MAPLTSLLAKNVPWEWQTKQQQAYDQVKQLVSSGGILVHFDPDKEIVVACDASSYGLGCVISHMVQGEERPVAFASCTLMKLRRITPKLRRRHWLWCGG